VEELPMRDETDVTRSKPIIVRKVEFLIKLNISVKYHFFLHKQSLRNSFFGKRRFRSYNYARVLIDWKILVIH